MIRLLTAIVGRIPAAWVRRIGVFLGWVAFHLLRVRRRVTLVNLERALALGPGQSRALARQVYGHLCIGALEFLRIGRLNAVEAREVMGPGLDKLKRILADGKGMLVLSAHLGNWDLLACAAALCGLPVNVVTRRIRTGWLDRFWMAQRRACGVTLLAAEGSARAIVSALRRNEIVAMVLDQHQPGGIPVPFFHRPASTATSLARLAVATGAPVVPVFLIRTSDGFTLDVQDPLELQVTGDRGSDVVANTRLFARVLQAKIADHPQQWLWLHRRWKADGAEARAPSQRPGSSRPRPKDFRATGV